jgi:hypothetical protein
MRQPNLSTLIIYGNLEHLGNLHEILEILENYSIWKMKILEKLEK